MAATPALACSLGAAARPGWPLRPLLLPASLCWTSGPTAGHAQVASAPARVGPDLACAGAGLGGVPSGSLPGRSAWLPGSWAALVYRCPKEEGPSEHWRESPLRPASHSEGAHQDSGRGERAEGGCRDELERSSEAAPGTRVALCPPERAATRSQRQEWADERCGAPATRPPVALPLCNAASGRGLWGGAQRKRRDGANRMRTVGPEPRACTGPTARPAPGGLWLLHGQLVPCWRQISTTRPGAPGGPAGPLQTGALQHRTQQGSREGPGAPRRGVGRRGQMRLGLTCYPGGSLSYPASVCLPMGWVPAGGSGDRGRLGAGCAASRGLALPWAATFRRPPTNAAPGLGS